MPAVYLTILAPSGPRASASWFISVWMGFPLPYSAAVQSVAKARCAALRSRWGPSERTETKALGPKRRERHEAERARARDRRACAVTAATGLGLRTDVPVGIGPDEKSPLGVARDRDRLALRGA
jgi:hypothetical protein